MHGLQQSIGLVISEFLIITLGRVGRDGYISRVGDWVSRGSQPSLRQDMEFSALLAHCVTWWRHQMDTFSALLAICAGNSPVPGEVPAQRPVMQSFDVFFDLRPNKRLSEAGDLRRHRAHYDVMVMGSRHRFPTPNASNVDFVGFICRCG